MPGEPLIFVHGWGMESGVWQEQAEFFAEEFDVSAVNLPGHGGMPPLGGEPLTIKKCGEALAEEISRKNLKNVHMVGWSLGAQVICHAAAELGGNVGSLSMVGGTPCFTAPAESDKWATPLVKALWFQRTVKGDFENSLKKFVMTFFEAEKELDGAAGERVKNAFFGKNFPPDEKSAVELLDDLTLSDIRGLLPALDVPSFILHGSRDRIVPVEVTGIWESLLPQARTAILPGCGHAPFITCPEKFNATLKKFLAEV